MQAGFRQDHVGVDPALSDTDGNIRDNRKQGGKTQYRKKKPRAFALVAHLTRYVRLVLALIKRRIRAPRTLGRVRSIGPTAAVLIRSSGHGGLSFWRRESQNIRARIFSTIGVLNASHTTQKLRKAVL